jgi:anti-sigma-K factor RskA
MRLLAASLLLLAGSATLADAQTGARRAAPSTRAIAEVSLTFADTAAQRAAGKPALIRLDYGQPHLRGRRINTDSLVPVDKVWRLGANAATLFTTDVPLTIGGVAVPAGRYIAQMLPARSGWTLILQPETSGAAEVMLPPYDASKDAARIPMRASTLATPLESLTMWLVPSTAPGAQKGEVRIGWDTVLLTAEWAVR